MNPSEEIAKRQNKTLTEISQLTYERYQLCKEVESCQKRIAEIDEAIAVRDAKLVEGENARRDFDTYEAITKGQVVTLEQLAKAAETGEALKVPKEAVIDK